MNQKYEKYKKKKKNFHSFDKRASIKRMSLKQNQFETEALLVDLDGVFASKKGREWRKAGHSRNRPKHMGKGFSR